MPEVEEVCVRSLLLSKNCPKSPKSKTKRVYLYLVRIYYIVWIKKYLVNLFDPARGKENKFSHLKFAFWKIWIEVTTKHYMYIIVKSNIFLSTSFNICNQIQKDSEFCNNTQKAFSNTMWSAKETQLWIDRYARWIIHLTIRHRKVERNIERKK